MKQILAILLIFQVLIGGVLPIHDQDETKGIPELVRHYYKHLEDSSGKISVMEFLKLHYKAGTKHQENSHENLPPYHWHEIHYLISFKFQLPEIAPVQVSALIKPKNFIWQNFYSFLMGDRIIHPPKSSPLFYSC